VTERDATPNLPADISGTRAAHFYGKDTRTAWLSSSAVGQRPPPSACISSPPGYHDGAIAVDTP
jgi:hypothetical protein